ncbi:sensor domain-containing diguanylate cyclase [Stenotrophomonas mori]|uniref:diguanylate cyclase n=1 Tax=Stenotrophomonas mori TaxID=2871096 RepID=A0ABT0SG82_9GAMM|nr:GGDEF domain-containing protein [Stenotrophomonas mori]MCL7714326.1 GGDEF domain-containing protein [Stenotrophomonas mori]
MAIAIAGRWWTGRGWPVALFLLLVVPPPAAAQPPQLGHDYLLVGAPTDAQTPVRACPPEALARLDESLLIAAPAGGWSGAPQAVDVFNVFAGEVMIAHGDRRICGNMQDARTRDSRFRAGIGMVMVPRPGDLEPIRVAWETPLKARWIPTLRLGAPSPVQQMDTMRLLVRTACIAIAIALALSALMGFFTTRDRDFLVYTLVTALLVVWQSVLSGLSGYPEPWLPVGGFAPWWLVSASALSIAAMGWVLWRLCGGLQSWPRSRPWVRGFAQLLLVLALVTPLLPWAALVWVAARLDQAFTLVCVLALGAGIAALRRGDYRAVEGIAAVLPLLLMALADIAGRPELLRFRVEAIQLSVTWFLMMYAYGLNRRLGHLRRQRDEMRQLADTDALTGLPNRRAGLRRLERHMHRARKRGLPLSIGFLDIDLFKQINDRFGHEAGDAVLVSVANMLVAAVGEREDVIRMGGEEFLVLLPGARAYLALTRLEHLRAKIARQASALCPDGLAITVSIGLAEMRAQDEDVAALLRRADNAMYRAKRGGRDRVVDADSAAPVLSGALRDGG